MSLEATLYVASSYYFDGDRFCDPKVVCMSTNLNDVLLYLTKLRKYIVINVSDPNDDDLGALYTAMGDAPFLVVADVAKYRFEDQEYMKLYMEDEQRSNYVLTEHIGKIDRRLSNLNKHDAKNMMVPRIVERIIDDQYFEFHGELEVTLASLKRLLYFVGREKETTNKIGPALFRVCQFIEGILKGRSTSINENLSSRHPILFCGEEEYRATIRMQEEKDALDYEYRQRVGVDDDIRSKFEIPDNYEITDYIEF